MFSFTYKMIRFIYITVSRMELDIWRAVWGIWTRPSDKQNIRKKTQKGRLQSTSYEEEEEKMKG